MFQTTNQPGRIVNGVLVKDFWVKKCWHFCLVLLAIVFHFQRASPPCLWFQQYSPHSAWGNQSPVQRLDQSAFSPISQVTFQAQEKRCTVYMCDIIFCLSKAQNTCKWPLKNQSGYIFFGSGVANWPSTKYIQPRMYPLATYKWQLEIHYKYGGLSEIMISN